MNIIICDVPVSKKQDVLDATGDIFREYKSLMDVSFRDVVGKINNDPREFDEIGLEINTPYLEIRKKHTDIVFMFLFWVLEMYIFHNGGSNMVYFAATSIAALIAIFVLIWSDGYDD